MTAPQSAPLGVELCMCGHRQDSHIGADICAALLPNDTVCVCSGFVWNGHWATKTEEVWRD